MKNISLILLALITLSACGSATKAKTENTPTTEVPTVAIEDKLWEIVEIYGKPVNGSARTHYLKFNSETNRLEAKANCNLILRNYTLKSPFQLSITSGFSTLKACPDNLEVQLNKALDVVDNYTVSQNSLSLNKSKMPPLIKLKQLEK